MKKIVFLVLVLLLALGAGIIYYKNHRRIANSSQQSAITPNTQNPTPKTSVISTPVNPYGLVDPIAQFKQRITKKPFGIYITPATSPVQPEKFTGYHTGVDVEYTDTTTDIPVVAITDAKVISAQYVSGYGGVIVLSATINNDAYTILYGHIRLSSATIKVGDTVTKGEQLAVLGTGYSSETNGERHHLHFSIHKGTQIDYKGYVQNQSELSGWVDPLMLYP